MPNENDLLGEDYLDDLNELDDMMQSESVDLEGDSDFTPDSPHWFVGRNELISVIRAASTFPGKTVMYFGIRKEGKQLHIHVNNRDAYMDCYIPILNEDAPDITRAYFLNLKDFATFVASYSKFALSFDEDQKIYFESPFAKIKLEVFALDMDGEDFKVKEAQPTEWRPFELSKTESRTFKNLFSFAVRMTDNKVLFRDNIIEAFFTLYMHRIIYNASQIPTPYILRRIDLPTLAEISEDNLQYSLVPGRIYFKWSLGTVSFVNLPYNPDDFRFPDSLAQGESFGEVDFDIKLLRKALKLISVLQVATAHIVSENQTLFLLADDKGKFRVGTGLLNNEFELAIEILSKLVNTIDSNECSVHGSVANEGLELKIEKDSKTYSYSLSKTTTGQLRRQDKLEARQAERKERKAKIAAAGKLVENVGNDKPLSEVFGVDSETDLLN